MNELIGWGMAIHHRKLPPEDRGAKKIALRIITFVVTCYKWLLN